MVFDMDAVSIASICVLSFSTKLFQMKLKNYQEKDCQPVHIGASHPCGISICFERAKYSIAVHTSALGCTEVLFDVNDRHILLAVKD